MFYKRYYSIENYLNFFIVNKIFSIREIGLNNLHSFYDEIFEENEKIIFDFHFA